MNCIKKGRSIAVESSPLAPGNTAEDCTHCALIISVVVLYVLLAQLQARSLLQDETSASSFGLHSPRLPVSALMQIAQTQCRGLRFRKNSFC